MPAPRSGFARRRAETDSATSTQSAPRSWSSSVGSDRPHDPAVQELMVHVHQVLVHERVVAGDLAPEVHGPAALASEARASRGTARWRRGRDRPGTRRRSRTLLAARVAPHALRARGPLRQVGHARDAAVRADSSRRGRRTCRRSPPTTPLCSGNWRCAQRSSSANTTPRSLRARTIGSPANIARWVSPRLHVVRPRQRVPEVGVKPDAPQVGSVDARCCFRLHASPPGPLKFSVRLAGPPVEVRPAR